MATTQTEPQEAPLRWAYVARCRGCEQVIAAFVDDPENCDATAKVIALWIKGGLFVDRALALRVPKLWDRGECVCHARQLPLEGVPVMGRHVEYAAVPVVHKLTESEADMTQQIEDALAAEERAPQ